MSAPETAPAATGDDLMLTEIVKLLYLMEPNHSANKPEVGRTIVACNCGQTCILTKNRVNERWRPISPGWKYRTRDSEDGQLGLGWYCGGSRA